MEERIVSAFDAAEEQGYITRQMSFQDIDDMAYEILEFGFTDEEMDEITDEEFKTAWERWSY